MTDDLTRRRLEAADRLDREVEEIASCNEFHLARLRETAARCGWAARPRHDADGTTARQWCR